MTWIAGLAATMSIIAIVIGCATARDRPPRDTCATCRQASCTREIL